MGGEIIFDFPGQFLKWKNPDELSAIEYLESEGHTLGLLVDEYLATPKAQLLDKVFERDRWGFTDILKTADRRLGKERLLTKFASAESGDAAAKVLEARYGKE